MTDDSPTIDERTFQDLVDEAKRRIPEHCPEWTNHGPTDPGITLLELMAWMTDRTVSHLNGIPDAVGDRLASFFAIERFGATPAYVHVDFHTVGPVSEAVSIPAGTVVATFRREGEDPVEFETVHDVLSEPVSLVALLTGADGELRDRSDELVSGGDLVLFERCEPGDQLLVGLSGTGASQIIAIGFRVSVDGVGVDPVSPPLSWETLTDDGWRRVDVIDDSTGGLQRDGTVRFRVPDDVRPDTLTGVTARWLRVRLVEGYPGQPMYSSSPRLRSIEVGAVGAHARAIHARRYQDDFLGTGGGRPGLSLRTSAAPLAPRTGDERVVVESTNGEREEWSEVPHFGDSGPSDRHVTIDALSGVVRFGPRIRYPDGSIAQRGAIPPDGARVYLSYRVGGGARGNVGTETINTLLTSVPYIAHVVNRGPAVGGADAETIEEWRERARLAFHTGDRAITRDDYERIARWSHRGVARAHCTAGAVAHSVLVSIVPRTTNQPPAFEELVPPREMLDAVVAAIEERRVMGTSVTVEPPLYLGVTAVAIVVGDRGRRARSVEDACHRAIVRWLDPHIGGQLGTGWQFGRPVDTFELAAVLQGVQGVDRVLDAKLFATNPITMERGEATSSIDVPDNALPFFASANIRVEEPGA